MRYDAAPLDSGLQDRVVLVTGASGGIGSACARSFAAEGAQLVLHARAHAAEAEALARELPVRSRVITADLSKENEVDRLFSDACAVFGRVDVLVANAGIWPAERQPVHEMDLARWQNTIAVDQTSVFLCCRAFLRDVARRKPESAAIVLIGSTAAVFGEEYHADYAAAKAAVTYGLTRSLKNEIVRLAPRGRVNAVCPGWTLTPMGRPGLAYPSAVVRVLQTRSIKRIARPEDVASTVVWLSSDRLAGHVTGQIVTVAGGMEGRLLHPAEEIDPGLA